MSHLEIGTPCRPKLSYLRRCQTLNELIEESKNGLYGLIGEDEGIPGHCLCILDTMDLNSVVHGSRTPMPPFESPFIGWTDEDCRSWINEHRHPYFAEYTFVVLDNDTAKNKTCRVGYTYVNEPKGDQMLIIDFYTCMPALEVGTVTWESIDLIGTDEVDNREKFEEGRRESHETYERMRLEREQEGLGTFPAYIYNSTRHHMI